MIWGLKGKIIKKGNSPKKHLKKKISKKTWLVEVTLTNRLIRLRKKIEAKIHKIDFVGILNKKKINKSAVKES